MKKPKRAIVIARLCLQAQLAISMLVPTGLLICVGPGGHVDLEVPHTGSPCHAADRKVTIAPECNDIVLHPAPANRNSGDALVAPTRLFIAAFDALLVPDPASSVRKPVAFSFASVGAAMRHTTVLLV